MDIEVSRYPDVRALTRGAAHEFLQETAHYQAISDGTTQLAGGGGSLCQSVYRQGLFQLLTTRVNLTRIEYWGVHDLYIEASDPRRYTSSILPMIGSLIPFHARGIHPIPAASPGRPAIDIAEEFETELGDTAFDVCVIPLCADGGVASIHPGTKAEKERTRTVTAVTELDPPHICLTLPQFRRSREVWVLAAGEEMAEAVRRVLIDKELLPAARALGTERTRWFIDEAAASLLPPASE